MNPRLIILRGINSGLWKMMVLPMSEFDARKWKGYRFYRSFPNNSLGKESARVYAKQVEQDERRVIR